MIAAEKQTGERATRPRWRRRRTYPNASLGSDRAVQQYKAELKPAKPTSNNAGKLQKSPWLAYVVASRIQHIDLSHCEISSSRFGVNSLGSVMQYSVTRKHTGILHASETQLCRRRSPARRFCHYAYQPSPYSSSAARRQSAIEASCS